MSTISASTTSSTAYKVTADTTGTLVLQTGASPTTAVTIDNAQNVGVGVTPSSTVRLDVAGPAGSWGIRVRGGGNGGIPIASFADVNGNGEVRIDNNGNLLVGTTDSGAGTGAGFKFKPAGNGASAPLFNIVTANSSNSSSSVQLYSTGAGAYRFYIGDGGTVYATSTSISAISDSTLKENIRDLETGLTEVMALRPRRFDWINGDAQNVSGFVAQEVEAVLPELVTDYIYNIDEEGNNIIKKSLKMGDILPTLVKAIQEQQAIIQQLQADVAALKGA